MVPVKSGINMSAVMHAVQVELLDYMTSNVPHTCIGHHVMQDCPYSIQWDIMDADASLIDLWICIQAGDDHAPTSAHDVVNSMVKQAAKLPFVHWVSLAVGHQQQQQQHAYTVRNAESIAVLHTEYSTPLVPSALYTSNAPAWDALGLNGTGQLVGMADAGLDVDSCFFQDPTGVLPGRQHRKVALLRMLGDGNDTSGHGTHVAATLTGSSTNV